MLMRVVLTLQQFILTESCVLLSLDFQLINECKDNCNQASARQSILTEIIICYKWLIKANPGVKDFAQTGDWTPVSQFSVTCSSH